MKKILPILLLLVAGTARAETKKTVYNPFTGKLDYITALSSSTLPAGSTLYVQVNPSAEQSGGFFISSGTVGSSGLLVKGALTVDNPDAGAGFFINRSKLAFDPTGMNPQLFMDARDLAASGNEIDFLSAGTSYASLAFPPTGNGFVVSVASATSGTLNTRYSIDRTNGTHTLSNAKGVSFFTFADSSHTAYSTLNATKGIVASTLTVSGGQLIIDSPSSNPNFTLRENGTNSLFVQTSGGAVYFDGQGLNGNGINFRADAATTQLAIAKLGTVTIGGFTAASKGLIIKQPATPAEHPFEVENSAGTPLTFIATDGTVDVPSNVWYTGGSNNVIRWNSGGYVEFATGAFQAFASGTLQLPNIIRFSGGSDYFDINGSDTSGLILYSSSNGNKTFTISKKNTVGINKNTGQGAMVHILSSSTVTRALLLEEAASQTANPFELRDSANTPLTVISVAGVFGVGTSTPNIGGYSGVGATFYGSNVPFLEMVRNSTSSDSLMAIFRAGNTSNSTLCGIGFRSGATNTSGQIVLQTAASSSVIDRMIINENGFVGVNTSVAVSTSNIFQVDSSTTVAVTDVGHIEEHQPVAPSLSSCGSSPSISGTDGVGVVTAGTLATSCTLTFANAWTNAPVCVGVGSSAALSLSVSTTRTTATVAGVSAGASFFYICKGYQ